MDPAAHPDCRVRLALVDDLPAAGETVRRAYAAQGLAVGDYLDVLADAPGRARYADLAVAVDAEGTVLGSVTFVRPPSPLAELAAPDEVEIRMLGVDPAAHRRGVGRALTAWCVDRAAALQARRVVLASLTTMTSAHALYTSMGFVRQPDLDLTIGEGQTLLAFALDLAAAG